MGYGPWGSRPAADASPTLAVPPSRELLNFYRLREEPFGVAPDPRYLYLSVTHRQALASLLYGIEAERGFLALIAKPGMGKTTLLFQLLEQLQHTARSVFLFETQCDSRDFFRYLLHNLGLDTHERNAVEMHEQLNQVLAREVLAGKAFVLFIDEAQNLGDGVLETVRLLSDFETPNRKLIQIVLSGQSQLADKLSRPGLAQLRQRISILSRLEPFSAGDTAHYIAHRLEVAGYFGEPLFSPEALAVIAAESSGIPRVINNLCFNGLVSGYALGRQKIDAEIVREVVASLDLTAPTPVLRQAVASLPPPAAEGPAPAPATRQPAAVPLPVAAAVRTPEPAPAPVVPRAVAAVPILTSEPAPVRVASEPAATPPAAAASSAAAAPVPTRPETPAAVPAFFYAPERSRSFGRQGLLVTAAVALLALAGVLWSLPPEKLQLRALEEWILGATNASPPSAGAAQSPAAEAPPALSGAAAPAGTKVETPAPDSPPTAITVVVQPGQSLQRICVQYVGRYDAELVKEILALNPRLKNPDHIEVGDSIWLPLDARAAKNLPPAESKPASPPARKPE